MPPAFAIADDEDLLAAVRGKTSYKDTPDELPGQWDANNSTITQQAGEVVDDAKRNLYMRTGSDKWYTDTGYGQALVAMTALKAKEAVENINIESYGIGDETLRFSNADPESSQQIAAWSREVERALNKANVNFGKKQDNNFQNTSSFIG